MTGLIFVLDHRDHDHDVIPTWNRDMTSYLRCGDATLFLRPPRALALSGATARAVERDGSVARIGRFGLVRVRPARMRSRDVARQVLAGDAVGDCRAVDDLG